MNFKLLLEFAKRDYTERYAGSSLGIGWAFIYPLIQVFIYVVIFAKIMGAKLPGMSDIYGYGIYLVAGLIPWTAFANSLTRLSTVFIDKKHLISKVNISLPSFGIFILISETITFAITMVVFILFLLISGHPLNKSLLFVPFIYIIQMIFAYGVGFLAGIFTVFIRDLKEVIAIFMQFWFWFTPIVYVYQIIPDFAKVILKYNPAVLFVQSYQQIFVYGKMPNFNHLIILTIIGHISLFLAYFFFKKLEKDIRDFA